MAKFYNSELQDRPVGRQVKILTTHVEIVEDKVAKLEALLSDLESRITVAKEIKETKVKDKAVKSEKVEPVTIVE
jgi:hypothetical protein